MRNHLLATVLVPVLFAACDEKPPIFKDAGALLAAPAPLAPPSAAPAVSASASAALSKTPPESVACQHVLVAYKGAKNAPSNVTRTKAEAKARIEEVLVKAKAGADFADLARDYSDDVDAKERAGSAGKFKRADRVKPFSDAAFALPLDGISEVVETPFGFHVIKRNQ